MGFTYHTGGGTCICREVVTYFYYLTQCAFFVPFCVSISTTPTRQANNYKTQQSDNKTGKFQSFYSVFFLRNRSSFSGSFMTGSEEHEIFLKELHAPHFRKVVNSAKHDTDAHF